LPAAAIAGHYAPREDSRVKGVFETYLLALRKTPLDEHTEHTGRTALETLLQAIADEADTGIRVQHEPKRQTDKGAPDFKVTKSGLILGYIENKGMDENLNKVLKSEQIKKYKSLSQNIVLTDYLDFIWINKYGDPQRARLCHATDLENKKLKLDENRVEAVAKLLNAFFSSAAEGIGRAQQLALALAVRSRLLRDYLGEELVRQEREHKEGRLYGLYEIFRDQVFNELTLKEFADALAQMLAYGLSSRGSIPIPIPSRCTMHANTYRAPSALFVNWSTSSPSLRRRNIGTCAGWLRRCCPSSTTSTWGLFTRTCRSEGAGRSAARCARPTKRSIDCSSATPSSTFTRTICAPTTRKRARVVASITRRRRS
jgi:hypothetical protein